MPGPPLEARARGGRAARAVLAATLLTAVGVTPCAPPDDGPEGALVVLPLLTGGAGRIADDQGTTLATLRNVSAQPVRLLLDAVSGDPGEAWASDSFVCDLVAGGEVTFTVVADGSGSRLDGVCADLGFFGFPKPVGIGARAANGILVAAVADPTSGEARASNALLAEARVLDAGSGADFTLPAVRVRAGLAGNDGDQVYRFDGFEYGSLPPGVTDTVRGPAPGDWTELVLFTLDGSTGQPPPPRVALAGLGEYERPAVFGPPLRVAFDFSRAFDCFAVVDLRALSSGFSGFPGRDGYLALVARAVGVGGIDAHDALYGNADSVRRRPVAGWAIEKRGAVVRGRLLPTLPGQLVPLPEDQPPVFDTDLFR